MKSKHICTHCEKEVKPAGNEFFKLFGVRFDKKTRTLISLVKCKPCEATPVAV